MGIGCGLLIASYAIILLHNLLLMNLGIDTQGEAIAKLFAALESPVWFFIVGALLAPLVEEIFFRGFLFQGFRAALWLGQRHVVELGDLCRGAPGSWFTDPNLYPGLCARLSVSQVELGLAGRHPARSW
jgi:hypothetical protein